MSSDTSVMKNCEVRNDSNKKQITIPIHFHFFQRFRERNTCKCKGALLLLQVLIIFNIEHFFTGTNYVPSSQEKTTIALHTSCGTMNGSITMVKGRVNLQKPKQSNLNLTIMWAYISWIYQIADEIKTIATKSLINVCLMFSAYIM